MSEAASDSSAAIRIERAGKTFGTTRAVRDLDLVVPAGSLCGFLGPNGAGKSTTIRMIMSIIYPDEGSISVLGGSALESKDRIGYLPEERSVYRKMKVGDFLTYIARLKGVPTEGMRERIARWLERIELPDVVGKKCEELSKGMQQKIQFLAAVIHEPELLILDEPFSGLDPVNAELLNRLIRDLHESGTTIIFSTHVLHQAELICDRIFLINHGVKLLDAPLSEIRDRFDPKSLLVETQTPSTEAPIVPGVRHGRPHGDDGHGTWELELEENADVQAVMRRLLDLGPMRRIELRRVTLEEVFVHLVREDLGEDAAVAVREELTHV